MQRAHPAAFERKRRRNRTLPRTAGGGRCRGRRPGAPRSLLSVERAHRSAVQQESQTRPSNHERGLRTLVRKP
eukprot:176192-Rhodomonas_salina.1